MDIRDQPSAVLRGIDAPQSHQAELQRESIHSADIYFNGNRLGVADNMHRVWEYPVKSLAAESGGVNTIRVPVPFTSFFYRKRRMRSPL